MTKNSRFLKSQKDKRSIDFFKSIFILSNRIYIWKYRSLWILEMWDDTNDLFIRFWKSYLIEAVDTFSTVIKHWNLFLKFFQTYPDIREGLSYNWELAASLRLLSTNLRKYHLKERKFLQIETKKIDISNIWVYHCSENWFIYSPTNSQDSWSNVQKMTKRHKCMYCQKTCKEKLDGKEKNAEIIAYLPGSATVGCPSRVSGINPAQVSLKSLQIGAEDWRPYSRTSIHSRWALWFASRKWREELSASTRSQPEDLTTTALALIRSSSSTHANPPSPRPPNTFSFFHDTLPHSQSQHRFSLCFHAQLHLP